MPRTDGRPPTPTAPVTLATSTRPRAVPVKVGVVADPHLATHATGTWKVHGRSATYLSRAVDYLAARDVDRVVVLGDLTKDSESWNVGGFDEIVADLPVPVDVLPGNHDVPKSFDDHEALPYEAFLDRYAPGGYPATAQAGEVTIVSLNTARLPDGSLSEGWAGAVAARQLDRLRDVLASATNPVVCCHHNLYPLPEHDGHPWDNFPIRNRDRLHAALADGDVPLVLSGHHHVPATQEAGGVREVIVPALCSYPHAIGILAVDRQGTRVELHPIATPDEMTAGYRQAMAGERLGRAVAGMAARRLERIAPPQGGRP